MKMKEYMRNAIDYVVNTSLKAAGDVLFYAGVATTTLAPVGFIGCGGGKVAVQPESELAQLVDKYGQAGLESEKFRLGDGWQIRIGDKSYGTYLSDKSTILTANFDPEARKDRWVEGKRTDQRRLPAIVVSLSNYGLKKKGIEIQVVDEGADGKPEYAFVTQSSNGKSKTVRTTNPQRILDWYKLIRQEIITDIRAKEDSLEFAKRTEEKQKQREMERLLEEAEREIEELINEGF